MRDIGIVRLYDKLGEAIGILTPVNCDVTEVLNGSDSLTMTCVYDRARLWKSLLPGARVGVWVQRCEIGADDMPEAPDDIPEAPDDIPDASDIPEAGDIEEVPDDSGVSGGYLIREYYKVADVDSSLRMIYRHEELEGGGAPSTGKIAKVGQELEIFDFYGDQKDFPCYRANRIVATDGTVYGGNYMVRANAVELMRQTGTKRVREFSAITQEEPYTITHITLDETGIMVEAVHGTIENGSALMYVNGDAEEDEDYGKLARIMTLEESVSKIKTRIAETRQALGGLEISVNVREICAVSMYGWNVSLNEAITTRLAELYEYDILRRGNEIQLYDMIGSDRGVVLEVGRNLSALNIDIDRDGSDMDGVIATCKNQDTGVTHVGISAENVTSSRASRYVTIEDENAETIAVKYNDRVVESRLGITAAAYRRSSAFKPRGSYTISVQPELAQIDGLWDDTPIVLGDIVTIRDPRLPDGEIKQRVVQRTQDCLTGMVKSITVGDVPQSLYDVIKKMR